MMKVQEELLQAAFGFKPPMNRMIKIEIEIVRSETLSSLVSILVEYKSDCNIQTGRTLFLVNFPF